MRLDEWQEYLESQFLDVQEAESAADKPEDPQVTLRSSSPTKESGALTQSMADADNWMPVQSAFGGAPFLLSANVTASTPVSLHSRSTSALDQVLQCETSRLSSTRRTRKYMRARTQNVWADPSTASAIAPTQPEIELRAEIPRHVLQLLELGNKPNRRDRETAQSSYKRPFQETRQELIARLLNPVISLEEAARLLNVCPTTVRRYTNQGLLSYYRKETVRNGQRDPSDSVDCTEDMTIRDTRQRRFRLSDILAFLEAQECTQVE